jgi:hypothetical protein
VRINVTTTVALAAATAFAIAVPAAAHSGRSDHPSGSGHRSSSHKCEPHRVAYIVYGTVDASQGPITVSNGTVASGTLEINVTRTNHWAKGDRPTNATQPVAYVLGPNTKVKFDGGTSDFTSGERVKLIGKAPLVNTKRCTGAGTVGTPTIRLVIVHPAAT